MMNRHGLFLVMLASAVVPLRGATDPDEKKRFDDYYSQYEKSVRTSSRHPFREFEKAVENNDLATVRKLLAKGLPVSLQIPEPQDEWEGIPPFSQAIHKAAGSGHLEMVKLLLDQGASANARNSSGATPLAWTSSPAIARLLIARGAKVSARDEEGSQAIHRAATGNNLELVKLLVRHGADPLARDARGHQPIHAAARSGTIEITRYLLSRGARVDAAIDRDEFHSSGWQPLHFAADRSGDPNDVPIAKLFLAKGATVDATTSDGETPLYLAKSEAITRLLLENGANVNAVSKSLQQQPLHAAALHRDLAKIRLLLDHGADIQAKSEDGSTPLDVAAFFGSTEVVALLLERGAKPTAHTMEQALRDGNGNAATIRKIRIARRSGHRGAGPPVHRR